ncbi:hypothetical protein ACFY00_27870 [Kitasatospora sp. NPDC001540]|uniref:hypothetical protein n=1 Tax=Kitasatospora sp. NPDC001540 TaxID=3364014 RepID=UPI00369FCEDD
MVVLDAEVRELSERTAASVKSEVRAVLRAKIVLAVADGLTNGVIAREFEVRVAIVATATGTPPRPEATWSHRAIGRRVAGTCFAPVSASQVGRIPAGLDLKPYKVRGWLARRDTPGFWQRAAAVRAFYLDPSEGAVVLSIDEKTASVARSRRHAGRPARPGEPARQEFEHPAPRHRFPRRRSRHLHRRGPRRGGRPQRRGAFTAFLDQLEQAIVPGREIHVVLDIGSSHTARRTRAWSAAHPRWHVRKLEAYVIGHDETAKPYRWTYEGTPLEAA